MNVVWRSWGFGSTLLGLIAAVGFVAASSAVPSAQAPASPTAPSVKPVTFTKDVAPILQRSCQNCHRPDQMAPMSLLTYEDARPYARSIKARTMARAMPPWHVERNIGIQKFKDDPSLTEDEIATIAAWVDQGAPKGNMADMPAPRHVGHVAFRRALVDPRRDRGDLVFGERRIVLEFLDADVPLDVPWRHRARHRPGLDRSRVRPRIFVRQQRHGRHLIGPMAILAGTLQNRRDILGERDGFH